MTSAAAYLPPKPVVVIGGPLHYISSPYDGAVASTSTNVFRTPGHPGQVSAFHKTVETPYSSSHKADVRYTNDVQLPYHHPAAIPYGHGPVAAVPYGYGHGADVPYGYGHGADVPYGHGPVAVPYHYRHGPDVPYSQGPTANTVVTPYSVSHASFSGPHGTHYSYRR
ncbi:PREDICTED: cuticle protein 76 [Diuraphis noxia]|uniref:cuticle protein 76 n=1 Tax=Diuraphis noxia TaxID=143948 RepID=UPI0007638284|nr:PREDICTED: cuticle protein 76 [Diuraphis noxia]